MKSMRETLSLCFSCKNGYVHLCKWIGFSGNCRVYEKARKLLDKLNIKYKVIKKHESTKFIILSCDNYKKEGIESYE